MQGTLSTLKMVIMQQRLRVLLLIVVSLCILPSCSKEKTNKLIRANATVRDFTGSLDGCGLLLDLDTGKRLEVKSLPGGITLVDGQRVKIRYRLTTGYSVCMAGDIADIIELEVLP